QALRLVDQLPEDRRAAQVLEREHLGGNGAEHRAGAAVLVERVDSEARQAGDLEREVDLEELLVVAALLVRHDVVHERVHLLVVERRDVDPADVAVHPDHRRQPGRQVQVRGLVLDRKRQKFGDIHASPLKPRWPPRWCGRASVRQYRHKCNGRFTTSCRRWKTRRGGPEGRPPDYWRSASCSLRPPSRNWQGRCAGNARECGRFSARTTCRKRARSKPPWPASTPSGTSSGTCSRTRRRRRRTCSTGCRPWTGRSWRGRWARRAIPRAGRSGCCCR